MGADDRWTTLAGVHGSYSALDSSWVMRDHADWFYELHNTGMSTSQPFTPWYPHCPAHDPLNGDSCTSMFAGSSPGMALCEGGVVACGRGGEPGCSPSEDIRLVPGGACSLSMCKNILGTSSIRSSNSNTGRYFQADPQCPDALKDGAPVDPLQCRDISKAQAKAINAALVKKDAAISKCIASPASCHPEPEFAGGDVLEQCWGE